MLILSVAALIAGSVFAAIAIAMLEERRMLRRYERAWDAVAAKEAEVVRASPVVAPAAASPRDGRRVRPDGPTRVSVKKRFRTIGINRQPLRAAAAAG
ncbi:MAG: hypothetical protein AAF532_10950 [Planctomycetota bacterium]